MRAKCCKWWCSKCDPLGQLREAESKRLRSELRRLARVGRRVRDSARLLEEKRVSTTEGELVPYEHLFALWDAVEDLVPRKGKR